MNFVLPAPSLQHLAGVKVVTLLWSQPDIFAHAAGVLLAENGRILDTPREAIEEEVRAKVRTLELTPPCTKLLLSFLKLIGLELCNWCDYNNAIFEDFQRLETALPGQLRWTMHGTVDDRRTAESLLNEPRVSLESRYELACINCLEDQARELIRLLPEDRRLEYSNGEKAFTKTEHRHLLVFFTCTLSGDERPLNSYFDLTLLEGESVQHFLFQATLGSGADGASRYLFERLDPGERIEVLDHPNQLIYDCFVFCHSRLLYYLRWMSEEQREGMWREYGYLLLHVLLKWPLRGLFEEAAQHQWRFLDDFDGHEILGSMLEKVTGEDEPEEYARLFRLCWELTTINSRRAFASGVDGILYLVRTRREEYIKMAVREGWPQMLALFDSLRRTGAEIKRVLLDESVISDATLARFEMEASNAHERAEEERSKGRRLGHFVDFVRENRGLEQ